MHARGVGGGGGGGGDIGSAFITDVCTARPRSNMSAFFSGYFDPPPPFTRTHKHMLSTEAFPGSTERGRAVHPSSITRVKLSSRDVECARHRATTPAAVAGPSVERLAKHPRGVCEGARERGRPQGSTGGRREAWASEVKARAE